MLLLRRGREWRISHIVSFLTCAWGGGALQPRKSSEDSRLAYLLLSSLDQAVKGWGFSDAI
jgi:hypothetical protein